jgi:microcystin degradation protein MlrC
MSDTPRTDALIYRKNTIEMQRHELLDLALALERELVEAKEQLRLCNVDQLTTAAELAEAHEELNSRRKFCYDVEQALEGMKGDYVEIISALRKGAAMKEGGK